MPERLEKFKNLSTSEKAKIVFLHLNDPNPLLGPESEVTQRIVGEVENV